MWQAYQYGQGKLKLVKDLKTGQAHLRVSLIDQEEIDNMGRIYDERKTYYRIQDQSQLVPPIVQQTVEEEGTAHLSYKEKVDLYRRRLQSEKLEDKYNSLFRKTEKRRFQMRNPILYKLLQNFEETHKHEDHSRVAEDLKESEKNLEMIKINTHRRARFSSSSTADPSVARPKFLSLENGLPQKQRKAFPKWSDFASGRFVKADATACVINLAELEMNIDLLIKGQPPRMKKQSQIHSFSTNSPHKDKHSPSARAHLQHNESSFKEFLEAGDSNQTPQKPRGKTAGDRTRKARQQKSSASRTFTRSENYSREVIATMSGFYDSKASKKQQYKKMVLFLKNDRPLTSDIRRKNYKMIGQSHLQGVKEYRSISQAERLKIRDRNYEFYMGLLHSMEGHSQQEIPLSGKIIERLRLVLQSNYLLNGSMFQQISEPSLYEPRDAKSEYLLEQIQKLVSQTS